MRGEFRVRGYDLGALLGVNASGETWLARSHGSGDQVALKRLRLRDAQAREGAGRLVSLLQLIDHPHLVRVRELLPSGDEVVLVLDHADGGSLDQLLSGRGALDPGEVVTAVAPVAEALSAAHERGLVHGDVTPESILFTSDGRPLLADIGLLGLVEGAEALGTHGYADPTVRAGEGTRPRPEGDVYALAAVCHTALTGMTPRPGQARPPLAEAAPGVPTEFVHAVSAGLQAVPARRPDAGQFADLVYAASPPAPVRFPVGLVLTDADIAAALGGTSIPESSPRATATPGPTPPATSGPGPAGPGMPAPGGGTGAGPGAATPADPFARGLAGGFHGAADPAGAPDPGLVPVFGTPRPADDPDGADDGEGRRIGLMIAIGGLALVLVGGAVAGGIAWANRSRPAPEASDQERSADGGDSASRVAPTASRSPRGGEETAPPSSRSPAPGPQRSRTPDSTPSPGGVEAPPGMAPAEARWFGVLTALDLRRAKAFATSDPQPLDMVYVAGSDLLAKDRAEIEKCVQAGCRIDGLHFEIREVRVVSSRRGRVDLEVVDRREAYTVVAKSGERTAQPAGEVTTRRITLVRVPAANWRIARILAA